MRFENHTKTKVCSSFSKIELKFFFRVQVQEKSHDPNTYHSIIYRFSFISSLSFKPKTSTELHSNMVVLEVAMPSGFITEKDTLKELLATPGVKLVETRKGDTLIDVYIEQMNANEKMCVTLEGYRTHKVAEQKPVSVRIYDYYDSCKY